jgi:hypothetical protein
MRKVREIKSKVGAIRNTLDDRKKVVDDVFDRYLEDLPSTDKLFGKKLDEFKNKKLKKRENKKDIFSELLGIVETFVGTDKKIKSSDKFLIKQLIKQHTIDSIEATEKQSKQIIQDNVKKIFFSGDGICGANSKISIDSIRLKPSEIDFLDVLTIDPNTNVGKIVYEPESPNINKEKVNRNLYNAFSLGTYDFLKNDSSKLFSANWDSTNQEYIISGLKQNTEVNVSDFFNDYFSAIEFPDITGITKTAVLLTIQGDESVTLKFNNGLNNLDRLLNKLFAICGQENDRNNLKNQNATDLFDENEEDIESYFDFNNVDEVDSDLEDSRIRRVLKFVDCNNFEIPVNSSNIEDFVYLSAKKNINDLVNETLDKASNNIYEQSDKTIPASQFKLSLINSLILNLPKALILNVLSPKLFLPIVTIYKMFKSLTNQLLDVKDLMKKLSKLFYAIVKDLFWKFISEFWTRIKSELLAFIRNFIIQIIKNRYKRYVNILTAIFQSLKKIGTINIKSCETLFNTILQAIEAASMLKNGPRIPGILLAASNFLPGLSKPKMMSDIIEILESKNIPTGDVYGEKNEYVDAIDSIFDTILQSLDKYSYVDASNAPTVLMSPSGPVPIPPGIIRITGKLI